MTGVNTISNLPPSVQGYYDKRALIRAKQIISAYDLCQKKTLPEGEGTTVTFWRYAPLSKNTTALSNAVTDALNFGGITFAGRQQFVYQEVPVTPELRGDYVSVGLLGKLTTIDQGTSEKVDVITQQAAESIDYILNKEFANGMLRRRADGNSDYMVTGTTTSAGSTTSVVDSARTAADAGKPDIGNDYYLGGFITITSGPAYGQTRQITAYTNSSGTFTTDAFDVAPGTSATYRVTVGTGINSSVVINTKALRMAKKDLKTYKALKFDGNYFVAVLDPDMDFDFFDDPDFNKVAVYKDRTDNLETGEIGKFMGFKFKEATQIYRETVAGVESDGAGAVHVVPIYGKEAVGCVNLGSNPSGKKNFQIYIRTWDQLGQPMPIFDTMAWQGRFRAKTLNGCFGIGLMCGASDNI